MRKQLAVFLVIALIGAIGFSFVPAVGVTISPSTGYLSISTNVVLAVSTIEGPASNPVFSPPMTWYDSDYTYRKSFNITNTTAGAQTDYQTKLLVSKNSGEDGSGMVNLSGHCEDDFDDIRFTNATGTALDYWTESVNSGTNATVWIELDNVKATENTSFYIYYGNSTVTSASNGTNTFIAFDDFEWGNNGDHIHTSGGSVTWTSSDAATISTDHNDTVGGTRCAKVAGGASYSKMTMVQAAGNTYAIRARLWKEDAAKCFLFNHGNATKRCLLNIETLENLWYYGAPTDTGSNIIADAWQTLEIRDLNFTATTYDVVLNDAVVVNNGGMQADTTANGIVEALIDQNGGAGNDNYIDNFIIRKYAAPEPTWGTWGSQETALGTPTVTNGVGVTNLTTTNATLNGNLTDDGGENCTAIIYWGDNDGVTTPGSWDNNETIGTDLTNGTFYADVTNLTNVTYYYRCFANNTAGSDWADSSIAFKQPAITNTPSSYDFGTVYAGETYSTGLTNFNITNTGDVAVNISISGTNMTGGGNTEEQTTYNAAASMYAGATTRRGQRLTISNRVVTKLSFPLYKVNSPTGNVTFTIRDLADNILNSKVWGNASALQTSVTWEEVEFTTPININGEVRTLVEFSGGDGANAISIYSQDTNVKANELRTHYYIDTYYDDDTYDCAYKYTYLPSSWTLNDTATPGADQFGLKAGINGTGDIDIGAEAKDRATTSGPGVTRLNKANPANASGAITSVEIWANSNMTGCVVGIFYTTNGNTLKCRSVATIGNVTAGSKQTFGGLSLSVQTGDYIGMYYLTGSIEYDYEGYPGYWYSNNVNHCIVDDETTYGLADGDAISLYGTGTDGVYNITVKEASPYNNLCTDLAVNATQGWGLELYTPTSFSDGYEKSGVVTLTATEA